MIENILQQKNMRTGARVTVKTVLSVGLIALAVLLPQLVHLAAGAEGGARWLPMYLPALLAGCLLGPVWGLGVGVLSPLCSFALTSLWGEAMPAAARLPYMVAELAVFAAVSGAFSKKIASDALAAFPAVLLAQVGGRLVFLALSALFAGIGPLTAASAWAQIEGGLVGLVLQAVLVPFLVIGVRALLRRDE